MQIASEEMEALNRLAEILSRFVEIGTIKEEAFELFKQMVVSSIDTVEEQKDYKRKVSSESPFSRLILPYMIGYYNEDNEPALLSDINIVNLLVTGGMLSFEIYNNELAEKLRIVKEFSIAPVLTMTKGNDSSIYSRHFKRVSDTHYSIDKCTSVNAPYETSAPIVFECSVESVNNDFFPKLIARLHKVSILESSIDCNGEFDICSAWARMGWVLTPGDFSH